MKVFRTAALLVTLLTALSNSYAQRVELTSFMKDGLAVHAVINGKAGNFMFDTGGGISFITPEFADKIGCLPWGQITGYRMTGERLDMQRCDNVSVHIAQIQSHVDSIGIIDLKKFMPPGTDIDGSLALDLFDEKVVSFSQSQRTLTVSNTVPNSLKQCNSVPVHLVRAAEGLSLTVDLPVRTNAGLAWFEMDSGNLSPNTLVNKTIAGALGLQLDSEEQQNLGMTLADGKIITSKATVLDLILDGNLGTSFLSKYDVTVDLHNKRAWIIPLSHACGVKSAQ